MKDGLNFTVCLCKARGTQFLYLQIWGSLSEIITKAGPCDARISNTSCLCHWLQLLKDTGTEGPGHEPEGTVSSTPCISERLSTCPGERWMSASLLPQPAWLLSSHPVVLLRFHFHLLPTQSSLIITGQGHWLQFTFLFTLLITMAWKDVSLGPPSN